MKKKNLPWVYLVFNWDILVACLTSAAAACAAVKVITCRWEAPFPDGAVVVLRVRPSSDLSRTDSRNITDTILRVVYSMCEDPDTIGDDAVLSAKEALPF